MPILFECSKCQAKLQCKEEQAGKRTRCPGCGEVVSIPLLTPSGNAAVSPPPIPSAANAPNVAEVPVLGVAPLEANPPNPTALEIDGKKPGRKRNKKKKSASGPVSPIVLLGIQFTRARILLVVIVFLGVVAAGVYFVTRPGHLDPKVRLVDVSVALHHISQGGHGRSVGFARIPGISNALPKLVVVRDQPQGSHLLVHFSISQRYLNRRFGDRVALAILTSAEVRLKQGNGEILKPLFLLDPYKAADGYTASYKDPGKEVEVQPPPQFGPDPDGLWVHPGTWEGSDADHKTFHGQRGMTIEIVNHPKKPAHTQVTWDAESMGWLAMPAMENPNNLVGSWEVTCLFPRPKPPAQGQALLLYDKVIPLADIYVATGEAVDGGTR